LEKISKATAGGIGSVPHGPDLCVESTPAWTGPDFRTLVPHGPHMFLNSSERADDEHEGDNKSGD
jgi:hypothetical protein